VSVWLLRDLARCCVASSRCHRVCRSVAAKQHTTCAAAVAVVVGAQGGILLGVRNAHVAHLDTLAAVATAEQPSDAIAKDCHGRAYVRGLTERPWNVEWPVGFECTKRDCKA
jgi:hypothetical protein